MVNGRPRAGGDDAGSGAMLDWSAQDAGGAFGRQRQAGGTGLAAATRLATDRGWRQAAELVPGDRVVTFDSGLQPLRSVCRRVLDVPQGADGPLLRLPEGAAGNRDALVVAAGQGVMLESDLAEAAYGDPFALVAADALRPLPGVAELRPETPFPVVDLAFADDEIVFAEGQALVLCRRAGEGAGARPAGPEPEPERYAMLGAEAARVLVAALAPGGAPGALFPACGPLPCAPPAGVA
jgi:hypothetical protein